MYETTRPTHPSGLSFDVNIDATSDDFVIADITVGQKRHFVFATQHQLWPLAYAKRWYVSGTFHPVWKPLRQWVAVVVPLVYVLMSAGLVCSFHAQ